MKIFNLSLRHLKMISVFICILLLPFFHCGCASRENTYETTPKQQTKIGTQHKQHSILKASPRIPPIRSDK